MSKSNGKYIYFSQIKSDVLKYIGKYKEYGFDEAIIDKEKVILVEPKNEAE